MELLQPDARKTPVVSVYHFEVPDTFRTSLILAIRTMLKPKKFPGPDTDRTEMLQHTPDLFSNATLALWRAVGRIAHVPAVLRSALPVPIYKKGTLRSP